MPGLTRHPDPETNIGQQKTWIPAGVYPRDCGAGMTHYCLMKQFLKSSWSFLLLAVLSFTFHLSFLSHPSQVVFDEVHFGKFVAAYSTGQYYFDIHPPLGKLLIAGLVKLTGANPVFDFEKIGESLPTNSLFAMRFLPAFFGGLFVLAFAWLAWLISQNKTVALLAGFLILLDNAVLVQSKFILVDIFLIFFEVLTLCFFFLWQRQKSFGAKWFSYLFLTAIFFGLTISIKWTGVATIGIIGVILSTKIFSQRITSYLELTTPPLLNKGGAGGGNSELKNYPSSILPSSEGRRNYIQKSIEGIVSLFIILFIAFLIYLLPFYLHFQLLPKSGPGDAFMSQPFQQELQYGRDNVYQPLNFWQKFIELNKTMYTANASILSEHPFGSKWYSWPLNSKPIYYWNQESIDGLPNWKAKIYFSGNPVLWWLSAFAVIFNIFKMFTKKGLKRLSPIFYILLLGYFANLLPFILITRVAFLYHYLLSSFYAILILSLLLSKFWPKEKKVFLSAIILIALGFIILSPLSYGWPMPAAIDTFETMFIGLFH